MAFAMLAASPMPAADATVPVSSGRTSIVVRADPRTGRLVRSVVARDASPGKPSAAQPFSKQPSKQISDIVEQSSRAHHVDPLLIHSMIKVESNYNPYAVSIKGAEGLMQLMPPTARMLGVSNSFDPRENIEAGVKYLKFLQGLYGDDRLALAAYNAGPGAVEKYKQVPPFKETQNYVEQVGRRYENARRASAEKTEEKTGAPAPAAIPAASLIEKHPRLEQSFDEHGRLSLRTVE
jgi:soluble lytic murein transglycosylase-like protein